MESVNIFLGLLVVMSSPLLFLFIYAMNKEK